MIKCTISSTSKHKDYRLVFFLTLNVFLLGELYFLNLPLPNFVGTTALSVKMFIFDPNGEEDLKKISPEIQDIYSEDLNLIAFHRKNWDKVNNSTFCQEWHLNVQDWTAVMTDNISKNKSMGCPNPFNTSAVKRIIFQNFSQGLIGCTRKTPRCKESAGFSTKYNTRINLPPCCRKHLLEVYENMESELNKMNVTHFMTGGGVIGWVRNKKMVPYDIDFDMLVPMAFWKTKEFYDFMDRLRTNYGRKCVLVEQTKMKVFYSDVNDINVDIWPYSKVRKKNRGSNVKEKPRGKIALNESRASIEQMHQTDTTFIDIPYYGFKLQRMSNLLPPRQEVFEHFLAFLPNDPRAYLDRDYGAGKWESEYTCKTLDSDGACTS